MLDLDPATVVRKGRLQPGRMFLVDTEEHRIIEDEEIKGAARLRAPLRRVAARRPDPPRRHRRPRAHRAHARLGDASPADLRLHRGGAAGPAQPDGQHRRRGARLDGHRHAHRRAERQAPPALRLLLPAVRAGDQPAARRDPRGAGHLAERLDRPRGQPAGPEPRVVPADRAAVPGLLQRRPGQDPPHQPQRRHARIPGARRARVVRRRRGRRGARRPPRRALCRGVGRDRRGCSHHRAVRPPRDGRPGADPVAAAHRRGPPPPGAREDPHPGRAAGRGRRRPRGAPRRAPRRLRRRGGQPLPGDGVRRGPRSRGLLRQGRPREGRRQPDQGPRQGRAQGDVEDGRLDRRLLHRRKDLRVRRPVAGGHRPLLHRYDVQARRHRARDDRRGGRAPARGGVPPRWHLAGAPRAHHRRRVPVAPRGRAAPLRPRDGVPAAARHPHGQLRHLQAVHRPGEPAGAATDDAARALHLQGRQRHGPRADRHRRGRAGLGDRQAVLDRSDVLRLHQPGGARDARRRDEPAGRQVQHR